MVDLPKDFALFKQGAEARLYRGSFLGALPAVAKERFRKQYRHPELDKQLTRDRVKAEVRALVRCKTLGVRTPTVYLSDLHSGVIVMEDLGGVTVTARDYIKRIMEDEGADKSDPRLVGLASKVGGMVAKLHLGGIIHGDLTTSNILVMDKSDKLELVVIDFGLSFAEGSAEDKGVDLYVLERAMLSTHPNTEHLFGQVMESYKETLSCGKAGKECREAVAKFEEVRMRGRKRTMVG